ncbi:hypothetical protein GUITHDRAFT_145822 [Guillardia theta CCMP2712]|uniref:Uncharacterized protein n=1 Tax=Guillardia theta (strain CCMP2712) TaxID=905079 RepID=L1IKP1_GUITC|nr:hypothetical protein GUITHDRAFT_145822 [Guillardia theta CCMP2712]EKX36360.1 hypothetical protein GUITHDRAFT_145822 [Guillardia theta CCMP2712]|eukprot:XP_005823340.1 hypothetical protein GUITHDRAFT_145822 [Guillardia theta CCMP2712]
MICTEAALLLLLPWPGPRAQSSCMVRPDPLPAEPPATWQQLSSVEGPFLLDPQIMELEEPYSPVEMRPSQDTEVMGMTGEQAMLAVPSTPVSKSGSPGLLPQGRQSRVTPPRARISSPWASPFSRPDASSEEIPGLHNDVITRMALSLGAPTRPARASLLADAAGGHGKACTEISLNSSASRKMDESVQIFGGVCDLLFYGEDLPIMFSILQVVAALQEQGSEERLTSSLVQVFQANGQMEHLLTNCAEKLWGRGSVKAKETLRSEIGEGREADAWLTGWLDDSIIKSMILAYTKYALFKHSQTRLTYPLRACSGEYLESLLAPIARGLQGPFTATTTGLKGSLDRLLSRVLNSDPPRPLRALFKNWSKFFSKKVGKRMTAAILKMLLGEILSSMIEDVMKRHAGSLPNEQFTPDCVKFLQDHEQVLRCMASNEGFHGSSPHYPLNSWLDSKQALLDQILKRMVECEDTRYHSWNSESVVKGNAASFEYILSFVKAHKDSIIRTYEAFDWKWRGLHQTRLPSLWAAFETGRRRRNMTTVSSPPRSSTFLEVSAVKDSKMALELDQARAEGSVSAREQACHVTCALKESDDRMESLTSRVTEIDFDHRNLTKIPVLERFHNLHTINISHNQISSLSHLPSSIRYLNCSHNCLSSLHGIQTLLLLENLNASNNQLEDACRDLRKNTKIMSIARFFCVHVLTPCRRFLNLSFNRLAGLQDFSHIPSLRYLNLDNNSITSVNDLRLLSLNLKLVSITCHNNPLTGEHAYMPSLVKLLPQVESVDEESTRLYHSPLTYSRDEPSTPTNGWRWEAEAETLMPTRGPALSRLSIIAREDYVAAPEGRAEALSLSDLLADQISPADNIQRSPKARPAQTPAREGSKNQARVPRRQSKRSPVSNQAPAQGRRKEVGSSEADVERLIWFESKYLKASRAGVSLKLCYAAVLLSNESWADGGRRRRSPTLSYGRTLMQRGFERLQQRAMATRMQTRKAVWLWEVRAQRLSFVVLWAWLEHMDATDIPQSLFLSAGLEPKEERASPARLLLPPASEQSEHGEHLREVAKMIERRLRSSLSARVMRGWAEAAGECAGQARRIAGLKRRRNLLTMRRVVVILSECLHLRTLVTSAARKHQKSVTRSSLQAWGRRAETRQASLTRIGQRQVARAKETLLAWRSVWADQQQKRRLPEEQVAQPAGSRRPCVVDMALEDGDEEATRAKAVKVMSVLACYKCNFVISQRNCNNRVRRLFSDWVSVISLKEKNYKFREMCRRNQMALETIMVVAIWKGWKQMVEMSNLSNSFCEYLARVARKQHLSQCFAVLFGEVADMKYFLFT